jgi:hypothetical protein
MDAPGPRFFLVCMLLESGAAEVALQWLKCGLSWPIYSPLGRACSFNYCQNDESHSLRFFQKHIKKVQGGLCFVRRTRRSNGP